MPATYDPSTDAGKVRLLISDVDTDNALFTDEEIATFLSLRQSNVHLAAALGLRTIAGNEAQVQKVIRLLDLDTDGAKLANALRSLASDYEAQADADADFGWAPLVTSTPAFRERIWNERLRES